MNDNLLNVNVFFIVKSDSHEPFAFDFLLLLIQLASDAVSRSQDVPSIEKCSAAEPSG
jgi:hypothetical protein